MRVAVVGATGLVGQKMLQVLAERNFPVRELIPVASSRSVGSAVEYKSASFEVFDFEKALSKEPQIALFSAGKEVSLQWAQRFVDIGCYVIDNSSAFRMFNNVPLVVPEVNSDCINKEPQIIANPNCSTIQLVAVLYPLHKLFGLKRVIVSTYQSVTGSGYKGVSQLLAEREGVESREAYPHPIDLNCIPHGGNFLDNRYTEEEMKLVYESRKILGIPNLAISGTVVRVPVLGGHSESVNIEFENTPNIETIREVLAASHGIIVLDNPAEAFYPMPLWSEGKDEVFVGRIRADLSHPKAVNMWIVADNLRKGAATNAVQIAEYIIK